MNWDQIKEIEKETFAYIGNHSHSHKYLITLDKQEFIEDIKKSNQIFLKELGYKSIFFLILLVNITMSLRIIFQKTSNTLLVNILE